MVSPSSNYIEIRPKSTLKFFFWSDPYKLPKDKKTLSFFERKSMEFVIALGKHTLNEKCYNKLQRLIDNHIGLNICLLDKDFAHLDNSHKFIELYKILKKSSIFNHIKEIYIDAEISNTYRSLNWNRKMAYILSNYPAKKQYQRAINNYNHLRNMIHKDGKKLGIIRSITAAYHVDKLMRNIPFDEINEDITVIMVYRLPKGRIKEYNDNWFYISAKKEGLNIFLGGIKNGYRNLKKDITICSHLRKRRIYIYDYDGFRSFCKRDDLKPYDYLKLRKNRLQAVKTSLFFSGIIITDKFLKFFK